VAISVIVTNRVISGFGELISGAEKQITQQIALGELDTETSITDRFMDRVRAVFEQHGRIHDDGILFIVRTLRDRGTGAPEKKYGADICGILHVNVKGLQVSKGFLAQAKMATRGIRVRFENRGRVVVGFPAQGGEDTGNQINDMLRITPDSYLFVYDPDGFAVVPAQTVGCLGQRGEVYGKKVPSFFKELLMCFIGDHRLKAYDDQQLGGLRMETNARTAMLIEILSGAGELEGG